MAAGPGAPGARPPDAGTPGTGEPVARIAGEQAALRRVATLVARSAPPEEVFGAVAAEVGAVLDADAVAMGRYDPDGAATVLATWTRGGAPLPFPAGHRLRLSGTNVTTLVSETGQPVRIDDLRGASGPAAEFMRAWDGRSAVGVPVSVEGRLWGAMVAVSRGAPPPADTEARLARFTGLVATAIANAHAQVELRGFAQEQAALRRVAMLVAQAAPPEQVFAAVATEAGQLAAGDVTLMSRYDPDDAATVVGAWTGTGALPAQVGSRLPLGGRNLHTIVLQTGRPARIDDYVRHEALPDRVGVRDLRRLAVAAAG